MNKSDKIFVAGHRGMVGSALLRRLKSEEFKNLLTRDRAQLDLSDENAVTNFFARLTAPSSERPFARPAVIAAE